MRKVDTTEICEVFNTVRIENLRKIFTPNEIQDLLVKHGIAKGVFRIMAQNAFFRVRKNPNAKGNCKQYAFTDNPIYKAQFDRVYQEMRNSRNRVSKKEENQVLTEESAVKLLKSLGYYLEKPVGINEVALKKECPQIYEKYLSRQKV